MNCPYPGCDKPGHAQGYCQRHYQYLRRHGELPNVRRVVQPSGLVECGICHSKLIDHQVTEFCYYKERF